MTLLYMLSVCTQDIRRFFPPAAAKPAVQKPASNGKIKTEERKKNHPSSDEEVKKNKKETAKARKPCHFLPSFLPWFILSYLSRFIVVYVLQVKSSKAEEKRKDSEKKRKKRAVIESGTYDLVLPH